MQWRLYKDIVVGAGPIALQRLWTQQLIISWN